jgi:hypothetical protein
MDPSVFAHALHLHKTDSRADILALLPAKSRAAVEAELTRIADFSSDEVRAGLSSLRELQAARGLKQAEEKLGYSLKHSLPRLITWLARPF